RDLCESTTDNRVSLGPWRKFTATTPCLKDGQLSRITLHHSFVHSHSHNHFHGQVKCQLCTVSAHKRSLPSSPHRSRKNIHSQFIPLRLCAKLMHIQRDNHRRAPAPHSGNEPPNRQLPHARTRRH